MEIVYCGTVMEVQQTLETWAADRPGCSVLMLLPEAERQNVARFQQLCLERGLPLAGAIFPAVVDAEGFLDKGVVLGRFDGAARMSLIPVSEVAAEAAEAMARAVLPHLSDDDSDAEGDRLAQGGSRPTVYLIFDGLLGHIASILDELYLRLSDRVTYAGVNAGSETFQPMPCLFDAQRCMDRAVLVLLLDEPLLTVLAHGYRVPERVMTATSTQGNAIRSIDWEPAYEVYRRIIGEEYGVDLHRENFYQYAVHFPMGILRASDDVLVRIPVALSEDGALICVGEVPENAMLVLLRAPEANAVGCIDCLAEELRPAGLGQALPNAQPAPAPALSEPLLSFYCAGRRMHLGDAAGSELTRLQRLTGARPMLGAVTLGEIGSVGHWGYPMFHNATLVCTAAYPRS